MNKRFTDKEFVSRRDEFLRELDAIHYKYEHWFNNAVGYYKDGSQPTLPELTSVIYDQDVVKVQVGINDVPKYILKEISDLKHKVFDSLT